MKQITKGEFKKLHANDELGLFGSYWHVDKNKVVDGFKSFMADCGGDFELLETTSIRLESIQGLGITCEVFAETIENNDCFFVVTEYDNAKDKNTSRSNKEYCVCIYVKYANQHHNQKENEQ